LDSKLMTLNLTLHWHNIAEYDYTELMSYSFSHKTPYWVSKANWCFGGTCPLHRQGYKLHGIISQKTELFITTIVRISNTMQNCLQIYNTAYLCLVGNECHK
jgi:hypothetical protein